MSHAAAQRKVFPVLRYANCWEDGHVLCKAIRPAKGMRLLSIASAGDNSFALAAEGAEVVAVDLNPAQLACMELKGAAIRRLEHQEVLEFLGLRPHRGRWSTYGQLETDLSAQAKTYWRARPAEIEGGFVHSGKFESFFSIFRRFVLPLIHRRSTVRKLLEARPRGERERFYGEVWDNVRWRALFRIFVSRAVMGRLGRDRECFRYVEGAVADRIMAHVRRGLTEVPTHANPFLEYIAVGRFDRCLPRYLEPERFSAVREGLDRLTLVEGPVERVAQTHAGGGFDGFNLSDIFEYLSEPAGRELHSQLVRHARSGARLAYWNMLVPRRFAGDASSRVAELPDLAQKLHATDLAFFYGAFILEEVR